MPVIDQSHETKCAEPFRTPFLPDFEAIKETLSTGEPESLLKKEISLDSDQVNKEQEIEEPTLTLSPLPSPSPFKSSKPKLKEPIGLQIMERAENSRYLSKRIMEFVLRDIERENFKLETVTNEEIEASQKLAEAKGVRYIWSILQNIGSYVIAIFNSLAGGYLITTGISPYAGSALVASSALTFLSLHLSDENYKWIAEFLEKENKERQETIAQMLPVLIASISIGLSLAGFSQVAQIHNAEGILYYLNKGIEVMSMAGATGNAYGNYKYLKAHAHTIGIEKTMTISEKDIELLSRVFEELKAVSDRLATTVRKTIKQAIRESRAVTMV